MPLNIKSLIETMSLGIKLTLSSGIQLKTNLNNEIIYEYKDDTRKISYSELNDIINNIKFWETENGRYIDMKYMTTSHILHSIEYQKKKLKTLKNWIDIERTETSISNLQVVLRDRNINDVLDNENFGLDNITI